MASPKMRSEDPIAYNTPHEAQQAFVNKQIAAEWLDLEKHVAWHGGYVLDQVICRHNDQGWMLIVKVYRRGRPYVAYVQAGSLTEAYEYGGEMAAKGFLTWKLDKWPSKWLKRLLGLK